ncbi:MAG TPA: DUF3483 domain-containing protein [Stellaceae bacterium]
MAGTCLVGAIIVLAIFVAFEAIRSLRPVFVGRAVSVDWRTGLIALPRRYLVDVHDIVARRPAASRMHAPLAGGLLAAAALLVLGLLPALRASTVYWAVVAVAFATLIVGVLREWRRRRSSERPAGLSRGPFETLPFALAAFAGGGFLVALDAALGHPLPLPASLLFVLAAFGGGLWLVRLIHAGPMRHALAGALHLVAHPRPARFGGGRSTALAPIDLQAEKLGVEVLADFPWNQLTGFAACVECGRCETACPAFAAGQPLNPKKFIQDLARAALVGDDKAYSGNPHPGRPVGLAHGGPQSRLVGTDAMIHPDTLWACTTCRACVEECPMTIEHVDAMVSLRRFEVMEHGALPDTAALPLAELRAADNPGGHALSARLDWAAGLDLPVLPEGGETDVLLWLGDGAFDLRYGRTLRALVALLRQADVDFAVLGAEERDCGDLARRLGDEATFQTLAKANIATLSRRRFRRIVTADPHALHVIRNEYPAFGGQYETIHHSAFLAALVAEGRLTPRRQLDAAVTYHDPCYLGRYNGEFDAPRDLLAAIVKDRREMARSRSRSMCCGGGGGAPVTDVPGERRIPDLRMAQAADTGAAIVAVACPGCTSMLEGVVGARPDVRDIAELLHEAVEERP